MAKPGNYNSWFKRNVEKVDVSNMGENGLQGEDKVRRNSFQVEDKVKEELEILKERVDNLNKKFEEKDKIICDLLNMIASVKNVENNEVGEVIKQVQEKLMMGKRCASGEKEDELGNNEDGLSSHGPIRKMGRHVKGRHKGRFR
ncbi:hypothetical protein ACOME3_004701 [Neoechinorhynchus agilis]